MATGPEHYRRAQQLLADIENVMRGDEREPGLLAEAQVHATLALAAATALGSLRVDDHGMFAEDANAWISAASASTEVV